MTEANPNYLEEQQKHPLQDASDREIQIAIYDKLNSINRWVKFMGAITLICVIIFVLSSLVGISLFSII